MYKTITALLIIIFLLSGCSNYNKQVKSSSPLRSVNDVEEEDTGLYESDDYIWESTDGKISFTLNQHIGDIHLYETEEESKGIYSVDGRDYEMVVHVDSDSIKMTSKVNASTEEVIYFYCEGYCFYADKYEYEHNCWLLFLTDVRSSGINFYDSDAVIVFKVHKANS